MTSSDHEKQPGPAPEPVSDQSPESPADVPKRPRSEALEAELAMLEATPPPAPAQSTPPEGPPDVNA